MTENICKLSEIKWANNKLLEFLKQFKGETIEIETSPNDLRHSSIEYADDNTDIQHLQTLSNKIKKAEERLAKKKEDLQAQCTHPANYVRCHQRFYRDDSDYPTRFYVNTTLECTICGKKSYTQSEQ